MAETDTQDQQEEEEEQSQETPGQQGHIVSALDPDFLIVAFLALLVDVLDWVLEIGTVVSLIIGTFFIWWLTWRTSRSVNKQEVLQQHMQQQEARRTAKVAVRKALRRGILVFIAELIPLINLIPFWIIFVMSALREKPETTKETPGQPAAQPA